MLAGSALFSHFATADDSVFTVMDDPSSAKKPFEGYLNGGYLAQSGNTKSSSLTKAPRCPLIARFPGTVVPRRGHYGEMPATTLLTTSVLLRNMRSVDVVVIT